MRSVNLWHFVLDQFSIIPGSVEETQYYYRFIVFIDFIDENVVFYDSLAVYNVPMI